jgi:hypothetical protein
VCRRRNKIVERKQDNNLLCELLAKQMHMSVEKARYHFGF